MIRGLNTRRLYAHYRLFKEMGYADAHCQQELKHFVKEVENSNAGMEREGSNRKQRYPVSCPEDCPRPADNSQGEENE